MKKWLLRLFVVLGLFSQPVLAESWPKEVTDILGNKVVLEKPPERIILASGYSFLSLLFVDNQVTNKLVAWGSELKRFDEKSYLLFAKTFPELTSLTTVGSGSGSELSAELILSLQPDLVIFDAWQAPGSTALIAHLNEAGIKSVFIDYYMSPLKNTIPSTRLLGQVLDSETQAEALIAYYQSKMEQLTSRLAEKTLNKPTVFLHAYAGVWNCCWSSGSGGVGEFISLFNGDNIGASRFNNANGGNLNLEYILTEDPDIYIATGHSGVDGNKGLAIGTSAKKDAVQQQLKRIVSESGLNALTAVQAHRVYGFWNYFSGSPFNIVGAEVMAKWLQPELYADIDPMTTMDELNQRFLPIKLEGTYWIELDK